ncbi:hypothetical protein WISP_26652 [Willisornis vidua]|uniref:Uncharacterized protein n=1 Tax=Willisornis vidua TaxID=1566151 RepID=A0ABQ9DSP4_9PASS|nr:hypothetical protein WISP_26652 [Willisornis vidua]
MGEKNGADEQFCSLLDETANTQSHGSIFQHLDKRERPSSKLAEDYGYGYGYGYGMDMAMAMAMAMAMDMDMDMNMSSERPDMGKEPGVLLEGSRAVVMQIQHLCSVQLILPSGKLSYFNTILGIFQRAQSTGLGTKSLLDTGGVTKVKVEEPKPKYPVVLHSLDFLVIG